jgi:hypothetical protein
MVHSEKRRKRGLVLAFLALTVITMAVVSVFRFLESQLQACPAGLEVFGTVIVITCLFAIAPLWNLSSKLSPTFRVTRLAAFSIGLGLALGSARVLTPCDRVAALISVALPIILKELWQLN